MSSEVAFRAIVHDIPGGVLFDTDDDGNVRFLFSAQWANGATSQRGTLLVSESVARQMAIDLQAIFNQIDGDRHLESEKAT